MTGTLATAFVVGLVTGLALVPIYRRAFQTRRHLPRVLYAHLVAAMVIVSLGTCFWLTGEPQGDARSATALVWLTGFVPGGLGIRKAYLTRVR